VHYEHAHLGFLHLQDVLKTVRVNEVDSCITKDVPENNQKHECKTLFVLENGYHLFSHSATRGSTGSNERTERIKPLIKSSGHSSSSSCPTTKGAFPGFTYKARHNVMTATERVDSTMGLLQ
jgi:hypothetical protein